MPDNIKSVIEFLTVKSFETALVRLMYKPRNTDDIIKLIT